MVKVEHTGRMTREKTWWVHGHTHCPRAGTRSQGPWPWTQSLLWVGYVTLNTALSLMVPIRKMGHWFVSHSALQMLEELFQHRGPGQETPPLPTSAGPELQVQGRWFSGGSPHLYSCPGSLNAVITRLLLLSHGIMRFLTCVSGITLHSTWQLCYFGLQTNFYSCVTFSRQRLSDLNSANYTLPNSCSWDGPRWQNPGGG